MKFLYKILGINVPSVEDIKQQVKENVEHGLQKQLNQTTPQILGYINFFLLKDGTISVKTEWSDETKELAEVYAHLIYQLNTGGLEEGILNFLKKYGSENVKSQEFIGTILEEFYSLQQRYKNLPLITPSQALQVKG